MGIGDWGSVNGEIVICMCVSNSAVERESEGVRDINRRVFELKMERSPL